MIVRTFFRLSWPLSHSSRCTVRPRSRSRCVFCQISLSHRSDHFWLVLKSGLDCWTAFPTGWAPTAADKFCLWACLCGHQAEFPGGWPSPRQSISSPFPFLGHNGRNLIRDFRNRSTDNWSEFSRGVFIFSDHSNSRSRPFFRSSWLKLGLLY